ncbi:uncharacterized protein LOC143464402 [Clavelina lepadiformis]|uniref:Uncharacterized protein n=1 Tax=Clavelina lepadiformis TaxID=159417 RepID=A0ABP0FVX2_CLALP
MVHKVGVAVSFAFILVGTGLYLTAMLTDRWVDVLFDYHYGLFKNCFPVCENQGWDLQNVRMAVFVPRIIMLAAAALVVIGVFLGLIGLLTNSSCPVVTKGVLLILAGVLVFAACGTFTGLNYSTEGNSTRFGSFHFSFYLGWVSGLMFIMSGICGIVAGKTGV